MYPTGGAISSSPAISDEVVYVGSGDKFVYALDALTGEYLWSFGTGGEVASSPAVAEGMVFVGSHDGSLYALDAENGEYVWSYLTGNLVVSSPAVSDGVVYFGSYDHYVYAIGMHTFSATFTAVDLPEGSTWGVILENLTKTDMTNSISFDLSKGSYTFTIIVPEGYAASPASGILSVDDADVDMLVTIVWTSDTSWQIVLAAVIASLLLVVVASLVFKNRKKR